MKSRPNPCKNKSLGKKIGGWGSGKTNPLASAGDPWAVQQLWLFWLAPLAGAVLAGIFYNAFLAEHETPPVDEKPVAYSA